MDKQEMIKILEFEYYGYVEGGYDGTFYEFLLTQGFNRFQLSALGISKEPQDDR